MTFLTQENDFEKVENYGTQWSAKFRVALQNLISCKEVSDIFALYNSNCSSTDALKVRTNGFVLTVF